MTFTTPEIILIIGAISLAIVNVITALKVKTIAHSVNSAASASAAKIEALTTEVAELKTAALMTQHRDRRKGKRLGP